MQSARLYLQSSDLGPPIPSPAGECVPPFTVVPGGGTNSLGGEGVGGPHSNKGTGTVVL
jgi:hypothetical protein